MVKDDKDQIKLPEECNVFPKRGKEDQGPDDTVQSPSKTTVAGMCGKHEYAGGTVSYQMKFTQERPEVELGRVEKRMRRSKRPHSG